MLALIHKFPDGVLESDVVDSYLGAADDAAALLESGDVFFLVNAESRERVLYPIDDFYEAVGTVAEVSLSQSPRSTSLITAPT
jgi:transcription initiation factor TFIIE subunit beta